MFILSMLCMLIATTLSSGSIRRLSGAYNNNPSGQMSASSTEQYEQEQVLNMLYYLGMDLYLKERNFDGSFDEELTDMMDFMTDDVVFCTQDEPELKGTEHCVVGKDTVRDTLSGFYDTKYDTADYTMAIIKNKGNLYKISMEATLRNGDVCLKSVDTDKIVFEGNKVASIDAQWFMFDDSNNCDTPTKRKKSKRPRPSVWTTGKPYSDAPTMEPTANPTANPTQFAANPPPSMQSTSFNPPKYTGWPSKKPAPKKPCPSSPSATRGSRKMQERVLKKFYYFGTDLFLENTYYDGSFEEEISAMLGLMTDDAVLCIKDETGREDEQCHAGQDAIKNLLTDIYQTKYDTADYTMTIVENEGNFYKIVTDETYTKGDICVRSTDTDEIMFDGNKIASIDAHWLMFDCGTVSDPVSDGASASTTRTPAATVSVSTTESPPDLTYVVTKAPKQRRMRKRPKQQRLNDAIMERMETVNGFYESLMECLTDADKQSLTAQEHLAHFLDLLSDTVAFCTYKESEIECENKEGMLAVIDAHKVAGNIAVYQGFDVHFASSEGNTMSVEVVFRYLNEENGCVTDRIQQDDFLFDSEGKILEYDNKEMNVGDEDCDNMEMSG